MGLQGRKRERIQYVKTRRGCARAMGRARELLGLMDQGKTRVAEVEDEGPNGPCRAFGMPTSSTVTPWRRSFNGSSGIA